LRKSVVEVAINSNGNRIPVGLMNAEQALALPDEIDFDVSHPDHEAGTTDNFIGRDELAAHVEAAK
jgi:hypothetical protein